MPGPVGKREDERRRRNKPDGVGVTKGEAFPVTWDQGADPDWHPIAIWLYEAALDSGQTTFYQNTDWALLYSLCDDLSYYKNQGKRSGQMLQAIMSAFEPLMLREGDRRRLRVELTEPAGEAETPAEVAILDDYRAQLERGAGG